MEYKSSLQGVKVPALIYGTAWKEDRTTQLVEKALAKGFKGIDTACQPKHYQEHLVGDGLERAFSSGLAREDIFLQTKFTPLPGQDPNRIPYDPKALIEEQIRQSLNVSLKNLKVDYIDSLVIHSPLPTMEETLQAWKTMEVFVDEGRVKQLGISNCYHPEFFKYLFEVSRIKPAVIQNRLYAQSGYDLEIREFCLDKNILYQSFWTLTANPHILNHSAFIEIVDSVKKTPAQVFFKYLNHIGVVPLTGTTSEIHMQEDLAIFGFKLHDDQLKVIDQLGPLR